MRIRMMAMAVVAAAATLIPMTAPADAAATGCISPREYRQLSHGMTSTKVKSITGATGTMIGGDIGADGMPIPDYRYRACKPHMVSRAHVILTFKLKVGADGHVKSAWLIDKYYTS